MEPKVLSQFPALLNLAGPAAFNSILGLLNRAAYLTYALSISCILWRRTFGEPLPPARWSLGAWGIPINVFSVVYTLYTVVISMFPTFAAVDAETMNWGVAVRFRLMVSSKLDANRKSRCSAALRLSVFSITSSAGDMYIKGRWCTLKKIK